MFIKKYTMFFVFFYNNTASNLYTKTVQFLENLNDVYF